MNKLICGCLVSALALSVIPDAFAWRGGGGGGVYHGAYGGRAVQGPGGNWAAQGHEAAPPPEMATAAGTPLAIAVERRREATGVGRRTVPMAGLRQAAADRGLQPTATARRPMVGRPIAAATTAEPPIPMALSPPVWPLVQRRVRLQPRPTRRPTTRLRAVITPIRRVISQMPV